MQNKKGITPITAILWVLTILVVGTGIYYSSSFNSKKNGSPFFLEEKTEPVPQIMQTNDQAAKEVKMVEQTGTVEKPEQVSVEKGEDGLTFEPLPNPNGTQDFYGKIYVTMNGKKYGPTLGSPDPDYSSDKFVPSFVMSTSTGQYIFNFKRDGQYFVNANGTVYGPYQHAYEAGISRDGKLFWNVKENGFYFVVINGKKSAPQAAPILFYDIRNPDQFYLAGSYDQPGPYKDLTTSSLEAAEFRGKRFGFKNGIIIWPCYGSSFHGPFSGSGRFYATVEAIGDLNNDGKKDGVMFTTENSCGTGFFKALIFFISKNGKPFFLDEISLGDRIILEDIAIKNGVLRVQILGHGAGAGLCCPNSRYYKEYRINNGKVEEADSGVVFSDLDMKALSQALKIYNNETTQETILDYVGQCSDRPMRSGGEALYAYGDALVDFLKEQKFVEKKYELLELDETWIYEKDNICCLYEQRQDKQSGTIKCGKLQ